MTENETKLILSNIEQMQNRINSMDQRISDFIENAAKINAVQEHMKTHDHEIEQQRGAVARAHSRIDEVNEAIEKRIHEVNAAITSLENAPAKNTHAAIGKMKSTIFSGLCGAAATGIVGLVVWLISSYIRR